ncbi:DEAD/DEAH box helicase family protein [Phenylobacterium sp.]|jgi:superfamily II DNA or RNA helicase|uniref:DEAD/DEAH box helicase n=1 Tax=Phenylobacterium sp. TaxID=1871053 RepID=UPI000C937789|nr:DEAD/DEAH box helicase family protein [Phenylobacterium sp.]MAK80317.1 ATP-dependent helicase [Phenylobacterium sp.]
MKAVLRNRIYMEVSPSQQVDVDEELTYTLPPRRPGDPPFVIKNMGVIRKGLVTLPIGRTDLIPSGHEIEDKRVLSPIEPLSFGYTLRASQQAVYSEVLDSCIINAWVSWGKTFTGLAIANKLGQRTLIVTHTLQLRNQWEKEIKKVFGVDAGVIGSGKFEIKDFTVGNVQTLYRRIDDIKDKFGTLILDEMHHVSSPTFSRIIDASHARYKIGLTGTMERKDGRHVTFRDYFSNDVHRPPKENFMIPSVKLIKSGIRFPDGAHAPWASRINAIAYNPEYQNQVALLAANYAALGHKVLLVSDRVDFLRVCQRLIGDNAVCITGQIPHEERPALLATLEQDKDVLCGTQAIFSEGISLNALSCLILATPINNEPLLTQLIGRVIRTQEGKKQPVIVDIHLEGNTARRQANARLGYYMKQGYDIETI